MVLIYISLITSDTEHLLCSVWPFVYLLWANCLFKSLPIFYLDCLLLNYKSYLYILDTRPLSGT